MVSVPKQCPSFVTSASKAPQLPLPEKVGPQGLNYSEAMDRKYTMKFYGSCKGAAICFFFPPPFLFFIAIPQSIKPLLSAPPLPAEIRVHFKLQHFGFQSSPWEFRTSFTVYRPLLTLFLIGIYLFTCTGTYLSQSLAPPLQLLFLHTKQKKNLAERELLCLVVLCWSCIEGYSEFPA